MNDSRFKTLESLFDQASELAPDARDTFVAELRERDPALADELANLLRHANEETSYADVLGSVAASALEASAEGRIKPGSRVGNIDIEKRIGAGGMGEVYLGQQREPFERPVAVKLVHAGLQVEQVLARFEAERQVLARMNHPAIAQVYDAGALDSGQPYVVMEYVDGQPIDEHCEITSLPLNARLDLFLRICDGVQHAHQRGVIHRDLKPSNVLVDATGRPKIIDFGIAKLVEADNDTKLTQMDQTLGTPQYMSPEQAAFKPEDVDTRSDVYALGVLLFELLTGRPPYDVDKKTSLEVRQMILETEPPRASRAAAASGPVSPSSIAGDLDWIIAKAMARDKERRYGSPAELAADIERHRNDLPVIARPDELPYRIKKFVRRHSTGVAVASVAAVTIVLGLTGTSIGLLRALEAERAAAESAEVANGTLSVIEDIFSAADPSQSRGEEITAKAVLDQGVDQIRANDQLPYATRGRLLKTMGGVYAGLSLYGDAKPLFEESIALYEANTDERNDRPQWYYDARLGLAGIMRQLGDDERRSEIVDDVLAEQLERYGKNDPRLVDTRLEKQSTFADAGDEEGALAHFELTKALYDTVGAPDEKRAYLLSSLALMYVEQNRYDRAVELGEEAVALVTRAFGPDHPETIVTRSNLAWYLQLGRRYIDAEAEFNAVVGAYERVFGDDHFSLGVTLYNLGSLQSQTGKYVDAMKNYVRARDIWRTQVGPSHPYVLVAFSDIAQLHYEMGDHGKSEEMYLELIALEEQTQDADNPDRAYALNNLGMVYHAIGRLDEAWEYLSKANDLRIRTLGESHEYVLDGHINLGRLARQRGQTEEAVQRFRTVIDIATERYSETHSLVGRSNRELGELLLDERRANDALPVLSAAVKSFEKEYAEGYWETGLARSLYGEALHLTGDSVSAEPLLRNGLDVLLASEDRLSRYTRQSVERLIRFYEKRGDAVRQAEAETLLETLRAEASTKT